MVTRREMVGAGALGALATTTGLLTAPAAAAAAEPAVPHDGDEGAGDATQSSEAVTAQSLREIRGELSQLRRLLDEALVGPALSSGPVGDVRRQFMVFLRSNQKYPDFCEVGPGVFTDLYDWHVRHRQPIEVGRPDGRMALRFMFTWMILRPEQEPAFIGIPFDRG